ncbi:MAG TPA: hypothetical protein PKA64_00900 [Myxococcota bacterium]|nr:hypothetical protein [Myxococcota bacterium]
MSDAALARELQRILESQDRVKIVRALARLLRDEEQRRERLEALTRFGVSRSR